MLPPNVLWKLKVTCVICIYVLGLLLPIRKTGVRIACVMLAVHIES